MKRKLARQILSGINQARIGNMVAVKMIRFSGLTRTELHHKRKLETKLHRVGPGIKPVRLYKDATESEIRKAISDRSSGTKKSSHTKRKKARK